LLEMDHLKSAIMQRPLSGDQSHPQSQFAIEGRDLFRQMWDRIAERVTDIIFKVRATVGGDADAQGGAVVGPTGPAPMTLSHVDSTGAGFGASSDEDAAMRAQGQEAKVATIRREQPKVGRNAPCPCGSGKKYKQCHGKGA
ncbi:MAG: SEC-C domain-containing protein, partial [Planctomycetes bacterium]|nr:SEC-C domain-containing protein [Planctomycetota bacterium]